MKIGIDARFYGVVGKGLGRYTQKLIEQLEEIDQVNEYFIFLKRENFNEYVPRASNFHKYLADFHWYTLSEQLMLPFFLRRFKLDLMHFPHFNAPLLYRGSFVITIHDLILLHFPTVRGTTLNPFFYKLKYFCYKWVIGRGIRDAKSIITVSNFTRKDIEKYYPAARNKIEVTYEACDPICRIPELSEQKVLEKYGIIKPYLLYVGNAYPHKNLEFLIREFSGCQDLPYHLVLVGKEDYFYRRLKKMTSTLGVEKIIFTDFIEDSNLDVVYKNAFVYVFPSLYEGFGLPPLEAMAKGTPVVSSDHLCMKEILGDAAIFFNANKRGELKKMIKQVSDVAIRSDMVAKGFKKCSSYSWKKMAKDTLQIYKKQKPV